eukprot:1139758-Pelagomonas_calceolata.AAC.3
MTGAARGLGRCNLPSCHSNCRGNQERQCALPGARPIFPNKGDQERFWRITRRFVDELGDAFIEGGTSPAVNAVSSISLWGKPGEQSHLAC